MDCCDEKRSIKSTKFHYPRITLPGFIDSFWNTASSFAQEAKAVWVDNLESVIPHLKVMDPQRKKVKVLW